MSAAGAELAGASALEAGGWTSWLWAWLPWAAVLAAAVLLDHWWHQRHFVRRGLPSFPSLPLVGSMGAIMMRRISLPELVLKAYAAQGVAPPDAPVVGFFDFRQPVLVVRDPALLRDVGVKRFDFFRNHRPLLAQKSDDFFGRSLFALRDQHWKDMRATMSPAFTASKMRALFDLVSKCGSQSADYLEKRCQELPKEAGGVYEVEFKDFFTRFTTDVIATSAFGVECDSLGQPNNEFYLMGKDLTNFAGGLKGLLLVLLSIVPKLAGLLGISFFSKKADSFFRSLIRDALTQRARRGIYRPDVLQLMMDARDGRLGPQLPDGQPRLKMTEEDIMGQAMIFFFAGFETMSILICFSCHLLATHPYVQDKLQSEIDEALEASGGDLNYEVVQRMKYLEMVISETLRLFPPAPVADRHCSSDVKLPLEGDRPPLTVYKGDVMWLPIIGLQRDPRYWPDPEKFDPERFSDENKHKIIPFAYMPFGVGPRICLAQRFAMLEAKVALAHLLGRLRLSRVERTRVPIRLSRMGFNTASADGYWCGVSLRHHRSQPQRPEEKPVGTAA